MIIKIQINDNLYIELESMHHGIIVSKNSMRVLFNIVGDSLNINEMHDLTDQEIKQVIKKLGLKDFMTIEQKQEINNKRKETLNKIIRDCEGMDRREQRRFKDRLFEVEKWMRLE